MAGRGKKGSAKAGGRQKGTPNKFTQELKEMILQALDEAGGKQYLVLQARMNPQAFLTLIGKVLPTTLAGDPKNPLFSSINVPARETREQWLKKNGA